MGAAHDRTDRGRGRGGTGARRASAGAVAVALCALLALGTGPARGAGGDTAPAGSAASSVRPAVVPASPGAVRELARLQRRIADHVTTHGSVYTFASYLDTTGRIVLESDAPPRVVRAVTGRSATATLPGTPVARASGGSGPAAFHRRNDDAPFDGGAGIRTLPSGPCSLGIAVRGGSGQVVSTASAACHTGSPVVTETGLTVGGLAYRNTELDVALIAGQSYSGRIYTGNVVSTTTTPVLSAGAAALGERDICFSGRTSGEQCGHAVISTSAQLCYARCWGPLVVIRGGAVLPQQGDWGGPVYKKEAAGAHVRGQVFATSGGSCYLTSWPRISATVGVSIVTG
ncbi:hypothetical protein ABT354_10560 [Streptomyces sp. NPDC000594]|uniref:hypothetical protein n=1 Tax=Streptomyces sp. NPDC000594 TaxID=3154261 RepID=UPI0033266574